MRSRFSFAVVLALIFLSAQIAHAQSANSPSTLSPDLQQKIDKLVSDGISNFGAPSAQIAIVKDGHIAYVHAYGNACLDPATPAKPDMRYSIGSISKQFTVAAVLLLQERGKLSLDDKVSKFLPTLAHADQVTIRELLSHTAGYQDFWPQDYVPAEMLAPTTPQKVLAGWADKPLDFEPGTKWQYSNTNYVIAALIVEKVSGMSLVQFLDRNIFAPLSMKAGDVDDVPAGGCPRGYTRYGLGAWRPAPKEGKGWLSGAGELSMTAGDLAKWDVAIIDRKVLAPSSFQAMETEVLLKDGRGSRYGLGVDIGYRNGRRIISHDGEVSGYLSNNVVFPDDRAAIIVLLNADATTAFNTISQGIAALLFEKQDAAEAAKTAQAKKLFDQIQHGSIDRSLLTANASAYFTAQVLQDLKDSLGPLGAPQQFSQAFQELRGGMVVRLYQLKFEKQSMELTTLEMPDGKLEQFLIFSEQ
jgi:D-alanyl-D-alanine carboxypeptidase